MHNDNVIYIFVFENKKPLRRGDFMVS